MNKLYIVLVRLCDKSCLLYYGQDIKIKKAEREKQQKHITKLTPGSSYSWAELRAICRS